ncbi:hypothetical protein HZ326_15340 [Fusarium oxysporum f. sp. albedinis]|nr:hypothetical protein HZ326_15340 [Fusarium oxysporum f. sp. albedinis]
MDSDSWAHSFCLACDKQVQSSTDAYCSESCRLADFEKTSTTSSQASSPGLASPPCQCLTALNSQLSDPSLPRAPTAASAPCKVPQQQESQVNCQTRRGRNSERTQCPSTM